jgi:hypothetical protein
LGQIHKTVLAIHSPSWRISMVSCRTFHRSTDIRVSVDDEHLSIHSHANLFPRSSCCFMILIMFGG